MKVAIILFALVIPAQSFAAWAWCFDNTMGQNMCCGQDNDGDNYCDIDLVEVRTVGVPVDDDDLIDLYSFPPRAREARK